MKDTEIQAFIDYADQKITMNRLAEITEINPFELIAAFKRYACELALIEAQSKFNDDVCTCGHNIQEHANGFNDICLIPECLCEGFEATNQ